MGKRWRRSARYFGACRAAGIGIPVGRWGNETLDPGENLCLIRAPRDFRDQFQRSGCLVCGDRGIAFYAHSVCWAAGFGTVTAIRALTDAPSNLPEASGTDGCADALTTIM